MTRSKGVAAVAGPANFSCNIDLRSLGICALGHPFKFQVSPVVPVCSTVYPIAPLDHGPDALQPPGMETPTTAEVQEGNHSESAVLTELVRRPLEDIAREVATLRAQKAALTAETERLTTLMPVRRRYCRLPRPMWVNCSQQLITGVGIVEERVSSTEECG